MKMRHQLAVPNHEVRAQCHEHVVLDADLPRGGRPGCHHGELLVEEMVILEVWLVLGRVDDADVERRT